MLDKKFFQDMYVYFNQICIEHRKPTLEDVEKLFTPDVTFKINDSWMAKNSREMVEHMITAPKPYKKTWFDPTNLIIIADPYVTTSHYFNIVNMDDSKERTMAINIFTVKNDRISDWTAVVGFANTEDKKIDDANFINSLLSKG